MSLSLYYIVAFQIYNLFSICNLQTCNFEYCVTFRLVTFNIVNLETLYSYILRI